MKNDCKNAIRHLIAKTYEKFVEHKSKVSVLSLPGESWEFENHILNHQDYRTCILKQDFDLQLVCFEKSFRTYSVNHLLDRKKDNKTIYINERLGLNHLSLLKNNNRFFWFDFCGNPSVDNLSFLFNIFKEDKVCAIFTFTLGWRNRENLPIEINELSKETSNETAIETWFKEAAKEISLSGQKTNLIWKYTYVSSRSPMICLCISNDPALRHESTLKGQGHLEKPDQDTTLASQIKGDLDAGEDVVCQMQENKRSLAAKKAWVTIRANKAKAALAAAQTAPENI